MADSKAPRIRKSDVDCAAEVPCQYLYDITLRELCAFMCNLALFLLPVCALPIGSARLHRTRLPNFERSHGRD